MKKLWNNFCRHIREGFYGVGRHAAMSLSSASAVTLTLLLISIFIMLTANMQSVTKNIEGSVQIFVKISFENESQEELNRIDSEIKAVSGINKVEFSSKDQEFDKLLETYTDPEVKNTMEAYREDNPLHHAYLVETETGQDIKNVADKIKSITGVEGVNYGGDSALMLVDSLNSIRTGGFILVAGLSILAIFLIANTIKLTIYARNNEISIMRNVGATNGFIRAPFVVEGIIIGALGSVVPILLTVFGYIYLYKIMGGMLFSALFQLIPPHPFALYLSLILLVVGILVGLIGSFFSVTKYLRWKR